MPSHDGEEFAEYQQPSQRPILIIAVVALTIMLVAACAGVFVLYRMGAFDELLAAKTPEPTETAAPPATAEVAPTGTPPPTILVMTATPQSIAATATPGATSAATLAPTLTPAVSPTPEETATVTPTETVSPLAGRFAIEYLGCEPHGSDIGSVKGQVFDRDGNVLANAYVWITLNGWPYDTPARSNEAGWYEFFLDKGLKVKIVSMVVEGEEVELVGHEDLEFKAQGGCFEHVNLRQQ